MVCMSTNYDEALHPRYNDGKYAKKYNSTPARGLEDSGTVMLSDAEAQMVMAAAAGGHNVILRQRSEADRLRLAKAIHAALPDGAPFEDPRYDVSMSYLLGGGVRGIEPGSVARANGGVLFLDEAPEFPRVALDALRQPMETGFIEIRRGSETKTFPTDFQLVLGAAPCPCGQSRDRCTCPPSTVASYQARTSGPLRDRVDIDVRERDGTSPRSQHSAATLRERATAARRRAEQRWSGTGWSRNDQIPGDVLRNGPHRLSPGATKPLERALETGAITLRGYDRTLRTAWTLADLDGAEQPTREHVGQALKLRKGML